MSLLVEYLLYSVLIVTKGLMVWIEGNFYLVLQMELFFGTADGTFIWCCRWSVFWFLVQVLADRELFNDNFHLSNVEVCLFICSVNYNRASASV